MLKFLPGKPIISNHRIIPDQEGSIGKQRLFSHQDKRIFRDGNLMTDCVLKQYLNLHFFVQELFHYIES